MTCDTWHVTCDTWQVVSKCIIYPLANITIWLVSMCSIISKYTYFLLKVNLHCNLPHFRNVSNTQIYIKLKYGQCSLLEEWSQSPTPKFTSSTELKSNSLLVSIIVYKSPPCTPNSHPKKTYIWKFKYSNLRIFLSVLLSTHIQSFSVVP